MSINRKLANTFLYNQDQDTLHRIMKDVKKRVEPERRGPLPSLKHKRIGYIFIMMGRNEQAVERVLLNHGFKQDATQEKTSQWKAEHTPAHDAPPPTTTTTQPGEDPLSGFLRNLLDEKVNSTLKQWESSTKNIVDEMLVQHKDEFYKEAQAYLKEFDIEKMAKQALKDASKNYRQVEVKSNGKVKKVKGVMPEEYDRIIQLAAARKNIMLVGPSGCGKTFIAEKVAEGLGLNYASQSCSAGMSESFLAGWLIPVGEGGRFQYISSQFVEIYEKGGVFLLDEFDAADPNTVVFFNQALSQDHFFLPQRYEKPKVKKHKDFVCIAAANTFGNGADMQFVGRNQLDAATLDRFRIGMVYMDYSPTVEEKLVDENVLVWGRKVRDKIKDHKLRRFMTTRFMLDATDMLINGWTLKDCAESYFKDWSESDVGKVGSLKTAA